MNSMTNIDLKDLTWRVLFTLLVIFAVLAACDSAFASGSGSAGAGNDVIGNTLCNLVKNVSGSIAKAIATMAIFAVGIGMFMGKLSWGTAALTAAAVGVIFGAAQIVEWLSNNQAGSDCPTGS